MSLSSEKRATLLMRTARADVERWADATGLDAFGVVDAAGDLNPLRSELISLLWWAVLCNNTDEIQTFLKAEATDEDPNPANPDDAPDSVCDSLSPEAAL